MRLADRQDVFTALDISIHAPVKGATCVGAVPKGGPLHFNPRTREGCDAQQRPYRQGREIISIHAPVKGATTDAPIGAFVFDISIHAPVKGATYAVR